MECITPDAVSDKIDIDYARPIYMKQGSVHILKAYVCVFVSLSVKAMHLELVADLTTEAFIAYLRPSLAVVANPPQLGVILILLEPRDRSATAEDQRDNF